MGGGFGRGFEGGSGRGAWGGSRWGDLGWEGGGGGTGSPYLHLPSL